MDGQEARQLAEEPDELDEPDEPLDEDVPVEPLDEEPLDDEPLLDESDDLDPAEGVVEALPAPMLDDFEDRESVR
ncbi:hypothetical protein ACWFNS_12590 [Oerskovia enterophila]